MNAMGLCKGGRHVNFARGLLRSYFDEPQKNEIHLLKLFARCFYSAVFIICEVLIKITIAK